MSGVHAWSKIRTISHNRRELQNADAASLDEALTVLESGVAVAAVAAREDVARLAGDVRDGL
jgi:hypothetical protein